MPDTTARPILNKKMINVKVFTCSKLKYVAVRQPSDEGADVGSKQSFLKAGEII